MDVKLVVVGGAASKPEIRLQLPVIVGRADDAGLTVKHPTVSRKHCELFERDGVAMVSDLGSTNGTLVDGVQINEALLRPGERLTIGPLTFEVVYDLAPAQKPAAPVVGSAAATPAPPPLIASEDELEIPFELFDTSPAQATPVPATAAADEDLLLDPEALEIHAEDHEPAQAPAAAADLPLESLELDDDVVVDDFLTAPPAEEPAPSLPSTPSASAAAPLAAAEPVFEIPEPLPAGEASIVDDEDSLFGDLDLDARPVEEFADSASGDDSPDSGIGWLTVSGTPPEIEIPLELAAERPPASEPEPAPSAPSAAPAASDAPSVAVQGQLDFDPSGSVEVEAGGVSPVVGHAAPTDLPPSIAEPRAEIAPSASEPAEELEPELIEFESLELEGGLELPPFDDEAATSAPRAEPAEAVEPEAPAAAGPTASDPLATDPWLNIEEGLVLPPLGLNESPSGDLAEGSPEATFLAPESSPPELVEKPTQSPPNATEEAGDEWLDELFGLEDGAAAETATSATDEPVASRDADAPSLATRTDEPGPEPLDQLGSAEMAELSPIVEEPIDLLDSAGVAEPLFVELELDAEPAGAELTAAPASTDPGAPLVADLPPADLPAAEPLKAEFLAPQLALPVVEPVADELDDLFVDFIDDPPAGAPSEAVDLQEASQPQGQLEPPAADLDSLFGDLDSGPSEANKRPEIILAEAELADAAPRAGAASDGPAAVAGDLDSGDLAELFAEEASDATLEGALAAPVEELFTEDASLELDFPEVSSGPPAADRPGSTEDELRALEPSSGELPMTEPSQVVAATRDIDLASPAPPLDEPRDGEFTSPLPAPPAPLAEVPPASKAGRGWWPFGRKKGAGDGGSTLPSTATQPEPAPAPPKSKSRALPPLAPPPAETALSDEPPTPPRRFFGLLGGGKPKPKQIPVYAPRPPVGGPPPGMLPPGAVAAAAAASATAPVPPAAPSLAAELTPEVELFDLDLPVAPAEPVVVADQPSASAPGRNGSAPHPPVDDDDFASFLDDLDDDK